MATANATPSVGSSRQVIAARRGFTLIELLVVIGIIVALIGLVLPAVLRAYKTSIQTRTKADLQLISTALEAYKSDFGDYPRIDNDNTAGQFNQLQDRGARLLCRALIGPGPATGATGFASPPFTTGSPAGPDGADGPGFRVRLGTGGKVYGPYVQPDKFNLGGTDKIHFSDATILDRDNNPILYYVATPHAVVTSSGTWTQFVKSVAPAAYPVHPLYNAYDNIGYGLAPIPTSLLYLSEAQLQWILGDKDNSGGINGTEVALTTQPYLLWSAGADGIFAFGNDPSTGMPRTPPFTGLKIDDVANFEFPGEIRK